MITIDDMGVASHLLFAVVYIYISSLFTPIFVQKGDKKEKVFPPCRSTKTGPI